MSGKEGSSVKQVSDQLLQEVSKVYRETGTLTDELMSALNFVYQAPLVAALDLVDNRQVSILKSPTGRHIFQVVGSSGTPYTCLSTSVYCSCPAFKFSVFKKDDHLMCKHVLAVKLSEAMGVTKHLDISDREMANILTHMD